MKLMKYGHLNIIFRVNANMFCDVINMKNLYQYMNAKSKITSIVPI